jgi:predicted ester cyclase
MPRAQTIEKEMVMSDVKALSRRWIAEGYGRNDARVMEELMPLEMLEESSWREQIGTFHSAFPDLTATLDDQLAEGERVVNRLTFRGTHTGDLFGLAPTRKPIELTIVEIHEWKDGQMADLWNSFHPVLILMQLGVIAPPA